MSCFILCSSFIPVVWFNKNCSNKIKMEENRRNRLVKWVWGNQTHPPSFVALSEHDDDGRFLLQHHLPEIITSLRQWALSGDVLFSMFVALDMKQYSTRLQKSCTGNLSKNTEEVSKCCSVSQVCSWRWCSLILHRCASTSTWRDWSRLERRDVNTWSHVHFGFYPMFKGDDNWNIRTKIRTWSKNWNLFHVLWGKRATDSLCVFIKTRWLQSRRLRPLCFAVSDSQGRMLVYLFFGLLTGRSAASWERSRPTLFSSWKTKRFSASWGSKILKYT